MTHEPTATHAGHQHGDDRARADGADAVDPGAEAPHGSAAYWDARYAGHDHLWSKDANAQLVEQAASLAPGRALDLGCGEGADALWLAERGWRVTGLDLSQVAVERAAARAEQAGLADRTSFHQADVVGEDLAPEVAAALDGAQDLVSLQFIHVPPDEREVLHARAAAAVAPGGSLLVVAHHPRDLEEGVRRPRPELLMTPEEVLDALDEDTWEVVVAEVRARSGRGHEGEDLTVHDTVVHVRRR